MMARQSLPASACTFWQRQAFRDCDDEGFGASPTACMSLDAAEAHYRAREAEDEKDPACGTCEVCRAVAEDEAAHPEPSWPEPLEAPGKACEDRACMDPRCRGRADH